MTQYFPPQYPYPQPPQQGPSRHTRIALALFVFAVMAVIAAVGLFIIGFLLQPDTLAEAACSLGDTGSCQSVQMTTTIKGFCLIGGFLSGGLSVILFLVGVGFLASK